MAFQSSLQQSLLTLLPPASLYIKEIDLLWNGSCTRNRWKILDWLRTIVAGLSKMDKLDFSIWNLSNPAACKVLRADVQRERFTALVCHQTRKKLHKIAPSQLSYKRKRPIYHIGVDSKSSERVIWSLITTPGGWWCRTKDTAIGPQNLAKCKSMYKNNLCKSVKSIHLLSVTTYPALRVMGGAWACPSYHWVKLVDTKQHWHLQADKQARAGFPSPCFYMYFWSITLEKSDWVTKI